ncbi:hypothetical protein MP228_011146 [Amoeboaphelidium protococcarum]|nr:hypothetical protein MP228_011146 [Amoeboaphelidium protococcarum]
MLRLWRRNTSRGLRIYTSKQSRCLASQSSVHDRTKQPPSASEGFLGGSVTPYIEQMYEAWKKDPKSVHVSWQSYFSNVNSGASSKVAFQAPPSLKMAEHEGAAIANLEALPAGAQSEILDHMKVQLMVRAYQVRGHHLAKLDPLGILEPDLESSHPPELEYQYYGFTDQDLDRTFHLGQGVLPHYKHVKDKYTLREIIQILKDIYCGSIGVEYTHIPDRAQCDWIRERLEVPQRFKFSKEEKSMILDRLIWSDSFEKFVATKYPSVKRFGLEGCEALIPGMKALIDRSVDLGVNSVAMGMAHRGRLNVLSNVVRKPNESIFSEFSGNLEPGLEGSGDVKYHLGMNYDRPTPSGKRVHLSLAANPSHLEAANPVVLGKVAAAQFYENDENKDRTMGLLLHGDAAFAAQGVVYETFGFSDLPNYATGGTVHIVINNQIGFTTDPRFARSTPYCTDVAKTVHAPILHVNGDDVESVVFSAQVASEWRQKYKKDIVIDIVCYRKYGHNEIDQPSFTQPLMYKKIAEQKSVLDKYIEQLIAEKTFTMDEIESMKKRVWQILEESYEKSKGYKQSRSEWVSINWPDLPSPKDLKQKIFPAHDTGISMEQLMHIGKATCDIPKGFNVHPVLNRIFKARRKTLESNEPVDWATAEAMAFGSLLAEGKHVRLSGQDVERGTFSHRHAVLHDQQNEKQYIPLNHLSNDQAQLTVCNSSLSEFGVMGFELGYSLVNPHSLILWEAQFGDFSNNAQCIIDQFIASGEKKWLQRTGLTLLLPHGFDGAGPEHSSARLERFLQLCDDKPGYFPPMDPEKSRQIQDCNMQVVYCSTPANYFHALRRQLHRGFRKPLVVMVSKSLLRHPLCKSPLSDMVGNTRFDRLIPETGQIRTEDRVNKVIFCTGQVYYALSKTREANGMDDVAIVRVEQISPFPFDLVKQQVEKYPNAQVVWAQEEPMNMGSWDYVDPRLETAMRESKTHNGKRPVYAGREPTGAVATGNKKQHEHEEIALLSHALLGEYRKPHKMTNGLPVWN